MDLDNGFILKNKNDYGKEYCEACYIMKQCLDKLNTLHRILFGDDLVSCNEMARKIRELSKYDK